MNHDAIAGWVIWVVAGRSYIGKPLGPNRLEPVYELLSQTQVGPGTEPGSGKVVISRIVLPFLAMPSIRGIDYVADKIVVQVDALSGKEKDDLATSVADVREMLNALRAQDAGIVLSSALPGRH
jgi:hypothetical protein